MLLFLTNCSSVKSIETNSTESKMQNLAQSHFGEKYATKKNETGSHFIVFKKSKKLEDLFATVEFFLFEEGSQSVIFRDTLKAGSVTWHSGFKIIAISRNLKTDVNNNRKSTSTYYYDVITKTITRLH